MERIFANRRRLRLNILRILKCGRLALPKSWQTTVWLLKMMLPISLAVTILQYMGAIDWLATYLNPVFRYMGLPGSSAIVYLTGATLTTYAGIAVMTSMALTLRQATILSLMMLLCHALPMECTVTHKTGSSFWRMMVLRIVMAFAAAFYLNWILPDYSQPFGMMQAAGGASSMADLLGGWCVSSLRLALMIFCIIYLLMVLQNFLQMYRLMEPISRPLRPLMKLFGLPTNAAYLWLVGNVLGISYGGAVMFDLLKSGSITKQEANEVNYHLSMNHSLLEDTSVFAAFGIGAWWIVSTRLLFAMIVVWGRKLLIHIAGGGSQPPNKPCAEKADATEVIHL
jgi:spore maturation protein SpmB